MTSPTGSIQLRRNQRYAASSQRKALCLSHRRKKNAALLFSLRAQLPDVALDPLEIGRVEHQRAVGHALDMPAHLGPELGGHFDRDLGRAHLLAILLGEMPAEIERGVVEALVRYHVMDEPHDQRALG